jgi:hypothetical protein
MVHLELTAQPSRTLQVNIGERYPGDRVGRSLASGV